MRSTWHRAAFALGSIVSIVSIGGCASTQARGEPGPGPQPIAVVVQNDATSDVVVFAYRGGQRVRVGFVTAHGRDLVSVPAAMANPGRVQLLLHPVGGGQDFVADEVTIRSGEEHAELHVTRELDESSMTVVPGLPHR